MFDSLIIAISIVCLSGSGLASENGKDIRKEQAKCVKTALDCIDPPEATKKNKMEFVDLFTRCMLRATDTKNFKESKGR